MARINGGIALAKTLRALGVREVFTLHGGHLDSFLVACADEQIRLTDTRHEASAGHAAEAYARATGEIGVCVITAGPGFSNALTAPSWSMVPLRPETNFSAVISETSSLQVSAICSRCR